ncbi:MAG: TonB-dependent receptor [Bacteroidota bacterium]
MKSYLLLILLLGQILLGFSQTVQLDSTRKELSLDQVVITAQYAPTELRNSLYDVRVIGAESIRRQGFVTLNELLSQELNLQVDTDPILGNSVRIQGIGGENVQIMIDGVPVIGRQGGNIDLSQILLTNIERVEIIQGAMSTQYGSNASGGVINLISQRGSANLVDVEGQAQYESVGVLNSSVSLKSRIGRFSARVGGGLNIIQTHPDDSLRLYEERVNLNGIEFQTKKYPWNPKRQVSLEGMLRYDINDSLHIRYNYRLFDEKVNMLGEKRRPQFKPYAFDQDFFTDREDNSLQLEGYLGKSWYITSLLAYNQYDRRDAMTRLNFDEGSTEVLEGESDTTRFNTLLHRSVLNFSPRNRWQFQVGVELNREEGSGERIIDSTSLPIDEASISNYAGWTSVQLQASSELQIMAAVRLGYNSKFDHPVLPSINALWKPSRNWEFRLNYARGFRAPSLKELHLSFIDANHFIIGNTDLKAESSHNASLTLTNRSAYLGSSEFQTQFKVFYNFISDRIVLGAFEPVRFTYLNIDQFQTHGVSLQEQIVLSRDLRLNIGASYTRVYNRWEEREDLPKFNGMFEMRNQLLLSIPGPDIALQINHRYIGKQVQFYFDANNEVAEGFVGSYDLVNASLQKEFWKQRIGLTLGVKNLFNTQTVDLVGGSTSAHGSFGDSQLLNWGRSFFVQTRLLFSAR